MSTSNIEYLDSKVQQMNLATFSEEQVSFQLDKSRVMELESENNALKLQLKTKEQNWNKDRAILTQKIELLESHIYESKIRQENLQKMNEAFMNTLNDLTANPKNFSNKMLKDLQQLFENRLQMDPDAESKLQKSALTIKQQQEEIEELKKKIAQYEQEIQNLKRKLQDNEKIIENSLHRQQQDLATLSLEKQKECKTLEKESVKMKQMYEKEILTLQKKHSDALNQINQLSQGKNFENTEQYSSEITRLNNIIDAMSQNHKLEIDLMRQQTQNELKIMENKQKQMENNANSVLSEQDSPIYGQKISQLETEKNQLVSQLQNVLSKLHQVSDQNSGITAALQMKESQIEELKTKMAQMQTSMPITCQDFFDVELQISRIEPERSKRRSIVNESLISNMTPMNNNRENNPPSLNMIGGSTGFNALASENGFSNNTSSNNLPQAHQNGFQPNQASSNGNNHTFANNHVYSTPNIGAQIPLLQNNYTSNQSNASNMNPQGYGGLSQSIQFNSINGNNLDQQNRKIEQLKSHQYQQQGFIRQGSLANSELSNCDTFGNPSGVKNKRVISACASTNNLANDFLHQNGLQLIEINGQNFLRTDQSSQSQSSSNQQQQVTMDTSIEKKSTKAGLIVQKKKLQSIENIDSQTSIHNLKTEDTVPRRERTTTTSASYHGGSSGANSLSCTSIQQLKYNNNNNNNNNNNGTTPFPQNGILHQELANKGLTLQSIQQQKLQKNLNLRNNSLNPNKVGGGSAQEIQQQNNNLKQHQKNQSLSSTNLPLAVQDLKKSMTDSQSNANTTNNNINSSVSYNNMNHYNSNQSVISNGNLLGVSQSFIKNNPMSQSSLLNQEQSFLVRAIQENMQERMTLEEKMRNLETEVQNYIMINQQKTKGSNNASSFTQLVQQVMKELYSKQLNKSIFLLSKQERENVLKQEIKNLVDKIMIQPLQQRQQSQENKSMIINQSLNKSISIEDGIMRDSKSPRYHQTTGNLGVSSLLNSSSLSSSKGFLNFVNQNKENSSFNPKQTGSLKSNSSLLSRIQVKPNSTTSFQQHLQGLQGQNFFDKKAGQFTLSATQNRNNRQ